MDTADRLDLSWMEEYKRLENISENCPRESMDCIKTYVLYIDKDLNIENILVESFALTVNGEGGAIIPKEVLLKYVQDKKVKNGVKYSLYDILFYNVDLESADIDNYVGEGDGEGDEDVLSKFRGFFRPVSIIHEIVVLPSLFIFHDLNSLFVLFKERGSENEKNHRVTMKSILKKVDVLPATTLHSNTKKVRILLPNDTPMKLSDKSKTRKMI
jgi:hypothetical protein